MIEKLISLDRKIFLALNHFATAGMDPVMRFITGTVPWIIFVLAFLIIIWRSPWSRFRYRYLIMLGGMILAYAISEQSSVHLFKEVFMRLRPCHEPALAGQVRLVAGNCGGQYGFVSTHATNSFTLAILSALLINRRWFTISAFAWALLVSYSRIYMGVHYPGDILCGAALGCLIGAGMYAGTRWMLKREEQRMLRT